MRINGPQPRHCYNSSTRRQHQPLRIRRTYILTRLHASSIQKQIPHALLRTHLHLYCLHHLPLTRVRHTYLSIHRRTSTRILQNSSSTRHHSRTPRNKRLLLVRKRIQPTNAPWSRRTTKTPHPLLQTTRNNTPCIKHILLCISRHLRRTHRTTLHGSTLPSNTRHAQHRKLQQRRTTLTPLQFHIYPTTIYYHRTHVRGKIIKNHGKLEKRTPRSHATRHRTLLTSTRSLHVLENNLKNMIH